METSQSTSNLDSAAAIDMRRYIGRGATPGSKFTVVAAAGLYVGEGVWDKIEPNRLVATISGKVPSWIPVIGGKPFSVTVEAALRDSGRAALSISGSVSGSALGLIRTSGDEARVAGLKFEGHLSTISEVSLTRWKEVETRFGFYRIPYTPFGFECWFVQNGAAAEGTVEEKYPCPEAPAGASM